MIHTKKCVRALSLILALFILLPPAVCRAEGAETASEPVVRITLERDLAENKPYSSSGTKYDRDFTAPLLNGIKGYVYKQTSDTTTWLFSVRVTDGHADVSLSFKQLDDMVSVSVNGTLLSHGRPVEASLNDTAVVRVATAKKRCVIRLIFTTLPVVAVTTDGTVSKYRETAGTVTVVDPDYRLHGWQEQACTWDAVVTLRGLSSSHYSAKHPYNFSLMKDGAKLDKSLLGMRTDSDWILDSAYSDASRMRNRVLMDVWNDIYRLPWNQSLSGATKGAYVELFMNGSYRGLFVLGEKQDRSQLGLAKQGGKFNSLLIRTRQGRLDNNSPAGFKSLSNERPEDDEPLTWYNVEVRYPRENIADYRALWADYYELTRLVIKGRDDEFVQNIERYVDLENLAVYWLFTNGTNMTDNMTKNMTFTRYDDRDERFNKFIVLPWDMDASLGRVYSSRKCSYTEIMSNRLFNRLIRGNVGGFREILYNKWQEMRAETMTVDHIMRIFYKYYDPIREAGADKREINRHPRFTSYLKGGYGFTLNFTKELDYIRDYLGKRLVWMDEYVAGLKP